MNLRLLFSLVLGSALYGDPVLPSSFRDPNPADGNGFGTHVVPLAGGNVVITAPGDDAEAPNAGAVYVFNGRTGELISTITGSSPEDAVGSGGVVSLANGNFVIRSSNWSNGGAARAGAATWGNGISGVSGVVSAANSLVGSTASQQLGGIVPLTNGNYVVSSPGWDNGLVVDAGAVAWADGLTGLTGVMTPENSLVGTSAGDLVGSTQGSGGPGVVALPGSNYVVVSPRWSNGATEDPGAVTWGSGTTGVTGAVSSANSLVGSPGSSLGSGGVMILTNGNYVVVSPYCYKGNTATVGAVTWGNAATGVKGVVSTANSLMGGKVNDFVGLRGIVTLPNGNYVVVSPEWDNGAKDSCGAVTWGNGSTGVKGAVSGNNSLVGTHAFDSVGGGGVAVLSNGNYVVGSHWWNGMTGAATWANGSTGIKGAVAASNSMIGAVKGDATGGRVTALANGNYAVISSGFGISGVPRVGAVTWGNGVTGTKGLVTAANSLIGSSAEDQVGATGIVPLSNGNYVVTTSHWDNGAIRDAGAVTLRQGSGPDPGIVGPENSLVGSSQNDYIGHQGRVLPLPNGNYVVVSPGWRRNDVQSAGAVTWGSGDSGVSGPITAANSLVGARHADGIGSRGIIVLANGNYVVPCPGWDNGNYFDVGAIAWGNGTTGVAGEIGAANSLIGTSLSEALGNQTPVALSNGNYVVPQTRGNFNTVSATLGDGSTGTRGEVHENCTGFALDSDTSTDYTAPLQVIPDDGLGVFYVSSPDAGLVLAASQDDGFPATTSTLERADGIPLVDGQVLDFGKKPASGGKIISLILTNTGSYPLGVTKMELSKTQVFSLPPRFPTFLEPGESATVEVQFDSWYLLAPYSANLRILSNSVGQATRVIALKGELVTVAEAAYDSFVTAAGLSGASAEPEAEPHGDGVANILKFAFNMEGSGPARYPLQLGGSSGLPRVEIVRGTGVTYLQVQYLKHYSNVSTNLRYTPKWSSSLDPDSFVPMTGPSTSLPLPDFPGWQLVTAREYIDPTVQKKAFAIVEVAPNW